MKHPKFVTGFVALILSAAVAQAQPKLAVTDRGVSIDAGESARVTLGVPVLRVDGKPEEKPVYTRVSATEGTAEYASGVKLKLTVKDNKINARFENAPKGARNFRFTMGVPMAWSQGGRFAFNDEELKPLPAEKGDQHVQHGNARTFTVVNPSGHGFTLVTPGGYQGVLDLRVWGNSSFSYHYQFDLAGRTEGDITFQVRPLAGAAAAGAGEVRPAVKKLVDRYGQNINVNYPGKITRDEELRADGIKQLEEMAAFQPDPRLDSYGGLAGSGEQYGLKKTGFFHVQKLDNGRWVMVSPEGNLFFQLGMCGIARTDDDTLVKGREGIYEWLPPKEGNLAGAWRDKSHQVVSFYVANLIRKFDQPYDFNEWTRQVVTRLKMWGFNSAGAFSANTEAMKEANFPRVAFLPLKGDGLKMLPDKIGADSVFDPFAPDVEAVLDAKFAKSVAANANDPRLIGYFLGNEQHFENLPKLLPTYKASKVPSKARLVEVLKEKYQTIDAFNAAWNPAKPFASFDELGEAPLFVRTEAASADMLAFYRQWLEAYYSIVRKVFDKHDKNHMLLGSRWTPGTSRNQDCVTIGSKYLDVVSINYYTYGIDKGFLDRVYAWSGGKPMLFSEWHYGTTETGLQAHIELENEAERAAAYRNYVEQSAATGYVVGHQWFIYTDQSITGRFFSGFHGEANQTGFVDVADRPYSKLVAAARQTHDRIYDVLLGKTPPYQFNHPKFDLSQRDLNARQVVQIPRALQPIKLDGTTVTFPPVPSTPISADRIVTGKVNPAFSGDYRVTWDDEHFYFHIQVKDPTPLASTATGAGLWNGDCVELFFGPKNLDQEGSLLFSDRQILIGVKPEPEVFIVDHPEDGKHCKVVLVKDVSNDGYTLQVAIPWKVLEIEPKKDMEMLFDVCIDNSSPGTGRQQQLGWNGLGGQSKNRGVWGRAKIVSN